MWRRPAPGGARFKVINGGVRDLANGRAQAATNAETQMLLASTANPKIRMLLTVAEGHYRIIGRKSAGINSLADLRGKKITTVPQTSAHYYLFRMLRSAGLQESDVTLVNVERTDMARAVARRDADAISMWEPEAQNALESLGRDASVFENIALYREWFSLYTTTDVLNDAARRRASSSSSCARCWSPPTRCAPARRTRFRSSPGRSIEQKRRSRARGRITPSPPRSRRKCSTS